jgi:hypothetical protein
LLVETTFVARICASLKAKRAASTHGRRSITRSETAVSRPMRRPMSSYVPPVAIRTTSMSIVLAKFVGIPGIVHTGRWMTANLHRARRILFGLSPVVVVGYFSVTRCSRIFASARS